MKKKFLWRKTVSLLLAGAMVLGCAEPLYAQAAENSAGADLSALSAAKVLELKFDDNITDSSDNEFTVTAHGKDGKEKNATFAEGVSNSALSLDGNTYLDLGTSEKLQPENMTVSFWFKATKALAGEHIIMWNKPSGAWDGQGWYLSCLNDSCPLKLSVGSNKNGEVLTEYAINTSRSEFFPVDEWVHVAVTYNGADGKVVFYRNGEVYPSTPATSGAKMKANNTDHKYLGFNSPGYGGGYATLDLDQYEIYSAAATADEVKALYNTYVKVLTPEEIVAADTEALDPFAGRDKSKITSSISLPVKGKKGSTITWQSTNEDVVKPTGKVIRPTDADKNVTLTATIAYEGVTATKSFDITVLKSVPIIVEDNKYTAYREQQFGLDEVTVTDSYYKGAQDADVEFLKKFDVDRTLVGYRENAGVNTKGAVRYSGWESGLLAGHSIGHYLSAAAQAIKVTGDVELEAKLSDIISGLKECQDAAGSYGGSKEGFLFGAEVRDASNVELQFDIVQGDAQGDTWVPWYNLHKTMQGLVDTYKYTGNTEALEVASKLGDWVYNRVSKWSVQQQLNVSYTEYGGMNDCMYDLYKYTHKAEHKEAAHKFDDPNLYGIILSGSGDTLKGRHANTTIPKFLGALNRYVALKEVENVEETDYLKYAEDFWTLVVEKHAFITGGTSDMEHFRGDNALDEIRTQCNCESCCAHNMLKLSKELYKITGERKYADYYENTLRNAIMGAVNKEGAFSYFTPMATGYYKFFGTSEPSTNMFWCCTGTGMENYTKLGDSIYFKDQDAIVVNQYVASEVLWKEKNLKLTQNSDVTASDKAEFTMNLVNNAQPVKAQLKLRVPDWAASDVTVKVNGQAAENKIENQYFVIDRTWNDNDKVELTYPMEVKAFGLPDNTSVYAFKYGPTVLAAKLGTEEWNETVWAGANLSAPAWKVVGSEKVRLEVTYGQTVKQILGTETMAIQGKDSTKEFINNINAKMEKTAGKLEFHIRGTDAESVFGGEGLTFVPFNTLNEERYGIYWYFESAEDAAEEKILAEKEEGRFAEAIVDSIQPGYQQYENDATHQMKEEKTVFETGVSGLGSTRRAQAGGYFQYNMKVDKNKTNSLVCQFAKEDVGKTIKITIGSTVFDYTVEKYDGADPFFKKYFEIPANEVANAESLKVGNDTYDIVKVKFESGSATEDSARVVNGLYLMRAYDNDAELKDLTASTGRIKTSQNSYTVQVPSATDRVSLNFKLATSSGLLYIDGKLINEAKPQVFNLKEGTTILPMKVYAQDHSTSKVYILNLVRADGLGSGEEIIENGTFDNGNAGNKWAPYGGATLGEGWSTFHNAARSLKIENRKSTSSGTVHDITGKVKAGDTYTIDGWAVYKNGDAHNPNPPQEVGFNVSILYGTNEKKEVMVTKKMKVNDWGNLYGDYTVPKDADVSKVLLLVETEYKENPTNDELVIFFIDDFSMKKVQSEGDGETDIVKAVMDKIAAIGKVELTPECKVKLNAARTLYEALTEDQKKQVTNIEVLTKAEADYKVLEEGGTPEDEKAPLREKVNAAKAMLATLSAEKKAALQSVINEVEAVLNKDNASAAEITAALEKLNKAIEEAGKPEEKPPVATAPKVGDVFTASNGLKYKVTAYNSKAKNVTVTGINKKVAAITVPDTVAYKNVSFKVTAIGNSAFTAQSTLKSATIGKYVTSIGAKAFYNDKKLAKVTFKGTSVKTIGKDAFKGIKKGAAFAMKKTFTSKNVKYKITKSTTSAKEVTVTGTSKKNITTLTVPSTVKYNGMSFKVTSIGKKAFKSKKKLKSVTIGKNVKTIGASAFYKDGKLTKITIKSTKLTKVGSKAFFGINKKAKIKVPAKKLKAYKNVLKNKGQKKSVKIVK